MKTTNLDRLKSMILEGLQKVLITRKNTPERSTTPSMMMRGSTISMITPDILKIITADKRCWTTVIEKWRLNKLTSNTI